jgi:hypothetical protein
MVAHALLSTIPTPFLRHNLRQTRLDINAPDFTAYKKTYPGLFK